jgi:hypothetical protein
MPFFYTAPLKELLQIRNRIFLESGLPALQKHGFGKAPFSDSSFGWQPGVASYIYDLCRLSKHNELEMITVHIVRRDRWIQIALNIFKLEPHLDTLEQLSNLDGTPFALPPNSTTAMRLKSDDIAGPPILSYDYLFRNHNLGTYYTRSGLKRRVNQLAGIIATDLDNIDHYVKRWHELHTPFITTWRGLPAGRVE